MACTPFVCRVGTFLGRDKSLPYCFFPHFSKTLWRKIGISQNTPGDAGGMLRRRENLRKGFFFQNPGILYNRTIRKTFVIDKCP